jgi:hypothetical protein
MSAALITRTGLSECLTTVSVTLPSTHRRTPERPWVDMAIKAPGILPAIEIISSGAKPSLRT